ncbi:hypothetical protein F5Y16DRAFT_364265 [Xylariaceae sp. FL0255]|nr:hypothetical protein F5Y16DRAFT_364265 [Xylariaceae sp. FL0255]
MSVHHLSYTPAAQSSNDGADSSSPKRHVLVFMISGNPGLIDYYAQFLQALHNALDASSLSTPALKDTRFHIYGQNLAGFSDDEHEPFSSERKPYDLEYQIQHTLKAVCGQQINGRPFDDIIMMGHSVGAYIALESWHRVLKDPKLSSTLNLTSGILLFPTIEYIARSSSGWKLNALRQTPIIGPNAYRVATGFLQLCTQNVLLWFVGTALGMPGPAADVTAKWLKSRDGVWQALHLGMDEMRVIGEDKWGEELWAIEKDADKLHAEASSIPQKKADTDAPSTTRPKFYLFFGKRDNWVSDRLRDEFIRKREKQTRVILDEGNLPHAFCLAHSEAVAEKVHGWICEMYDHSSS